MTFILFLLVFIPSYFYSFLFVLREQRMDQKSSRRSQGQALLKARKPYSLGQKTYSKSWYTPLLRMGKVALPALQPHAQAAAKAAPVKERIRGFSLVFPACQDLHIST